MGHTDNTGSEKFDLKLSQYRAQTMKDYLVNKGIAASRISVEGKGMKEPLNDNSTDAKRALNRRVELTITTSRKFLSRELEVSVEDLPQRKYKRFSLRRARILDLIQALCGSQRITSVFSLR